jgi:diguanylate cyclase (GGDEF)-like protein
VPPIAEELARIHERTRRPTLIVLSGLDMGNALPVTEAGVQIGRADSCGLILRDDGISRTHVDVKPYGDDGLIARDLGSTNGTFVRGQRVEVAELRNGEKILLGRRTLLKFVLQDEIDLKYQQEMYESSIRDGLTGMFNRRYFNQKMLTDISFARRHKIPLSLIMFDIDHFKRVNDTYGHRTGDQVLTAFAATVAGSIRTEDVLARFGGEEFVIIAQATGSEGALVLAERIRQTVGEQVVQAVDGSDEEVRITVSAGVVTLNPGADQDPAGVISVADANLYAAKHGGRDRVIATEID